MNNSYNRNPIKDEVHIIIYMYQKVIEDIRRNLGENNELNCKYLISQIEIGYPKQKINIYLSSKDYEFYIEENLTN